MEINSIKEIGSGYAPFNFEQVHYSINGRMDDLLDFQEIVVAVSVNRANVIEEEIKPLTAVLRRRVEKLKQLGEVSADVAASIFQFEKDAGQDDTTVVSNWAYARDVLKKYDVKCLIDGSGRISKANTQKQSAAVRHAIDLEDNQLEQDNVSIRSLLSKRDQGISTASQLMKKISDVRSKTINGIGN